LKSTLKYKVSENFLNLQEAIGIFMDWHQVGVFHRVQIRKKAMDKQ